MERIKLSREAKSVINSLVKGSYCCHKHILQSDFNVGALELQRHQLVYCHEEESGNIEVVRLSYLGKIYIKENPSLRNPIDWK